VTSSCSDKADRAVEAFEGGLHGSVAAQCQYTNVAISLIQRAAMERSNPRKRRHNDSTGEADSAIVSAKGQKKRTENVWDTLWVVHLSRASLDEFDRRVKETQPPLRRTATTRSAPPLEYDSTRLKHLVASGGLDFSHLRGVGTSIQECAGLDTNVTAVCRLYSSGKHGSKVRRCRSYPYYENNDQPVRSQV